MGELYEKQPDGTLKPAEQPEQLVKKVALYEWLKARGMNLDEAKYMLEPTFWV
jgi:hypothetical protein